MPRAQAIDPARIQALLQWAITNAPAIAQLVMGLLELIQKKQQQMETAKYGSAVGCDPAACDDVEECCHETVKHCCAALQCALRSCECCDENP